MATPNIDLTGLDFTEIKNNLKSYLRGQDRFKDYDFDGSNMSVILDILAYNTYMNSFYLNMVGSEMFLDTAQQRDSVVLRAKELNYLPRSFRSAVANVDIVITSKNTNKSILTIPKGTSFTGKAGSNSYSFVTDQNIVLTGNTIGSNVVFTANSVSLYEGAYQTENFAVNYSLDPQKYTISNPRIDTTSLKVLVVENNGANVTPFMYSPTLLDLKSTSPVYFLQGSENNSYQIYFGDNNVGRKPLNGSVVVLDYRIPSGELPNGINIFSPDSQIDGEKDITLNVNLPASGGIISESINSIKYYAPLSFSTQDRAITTNDYEILMRQTFPEINAISVYGGEEITPKQYGKVFIALQISGFSGLPESKKTEYYNFISRRAGITTTPVFVLPDYLYVKVSTNIKYNLNTSGLNLSDISTLAISSIQSYNLSSLNDFKSDFHYSRIVSAIDNSHPSIISNDTDVLMFKKVNPTLGLGSNITVNFNVPIDNTIPPIASNHVSYQIHAVTSSQFVVNGTTVSMEDDSSGNLRLVTYSGGEHFSLYNIGTVNYDTGILTINNLIVTSYFGDSIRIYVRSRFKDFSSSTNAILSISNDEIFTTVEAVRV